MSRFDESFKRICQYHDMNQEFYALGAAVDVNGSKEIMQLIADLFDATTLDERWSLLKTCFAEFGADQINYGLFETFVPDRDKAPIGLLSTMDPSWIKFYGEQRIDLLDLHLDLVRDQPVPTYLWGERGLRTVDKEHLSEMRAAIELTHEAGLRCAIHLTLENPWNPVKPAGMMAIGSSLPEEDYFASVMPHQQAITVAAQVFHMLALGEMRSRELGNAKLTPRERECLKYIADGSRIDAVADQLTISRGTVEMHLRNARQKLGAKTLPEAVAKALIVQELRFN